MIKNIGEQTEKQIQPVGNNRTKESLRENVLKGDKVQRGLNVKQNEIAMDCLEKEKNEDFDNSSNINPKHNNLENSRMQSEDPKRKTKKPAKYEEISCKSCGMTDKSKIIDCYLCKKIICKSCVDKEPKFSSKKREQSSYICESCLNNNSLKLRKKFSFGDFHGISNNLNPLTYDLNNFNIKNSKNMKKKSQSLKDDEEIKKAEEPIKLEKEDMLNLDFIYECISPPSELNCNTRVNAKLSITTPIMTRKKHRRVRTRHDPFFDKVCHQCNKCNPNVEYFQCSKAECGYIYCNKCIRKYSSIGNTKHINKITKTLNFCYSCRNICKCQKCQKEISTRKSKNIVQVDLENLDGNKNIVKIDDYLIIENSEVEEFTEEIEEPAKDMKSIVDQDMSKEIVTQEINDIKETNILIKNQKSPAKHSSPEEEKIKACVEAVESSRTFNKVFKPVRCIICTYDFQGDSYKGFYKFKSLEEFITYLKYFFGLQGVKENPEYFESLYEYNDYLLNYFKKYYSNSDYVFKSMKIICKECFNSSLKIKNGFYNLFSSLHIGNNITNTTIKLAENKIKAVFTNNYDKAHQEIKQVENLSAERHNNSGNNNNNSDSKGLPKSSTNLKNDMIGANSTIKANQKNNNNFINSTNMHSTNFNSDTNTQNPNTNKSKGLTTGPNLLNLNKTSQNTNSNFNQGYNLFNSHQNPGNSNTANNPNNVNSGNNTSSINKIYEMFSNIRQNPGTNNSNLYTNNILKNYLNQNLNNNLGCNGVNMNNLSGIFNTNSEFLHNKIQNRSIFDIHNMQNMENTFENVGPSSMRNVANKGHNNNTNNNQNVENTTNSNIDNNQEKEHLMNLISNLNPEAMNVTNIIMNIDNNKGSNGFSGNVLDELKKQFFCIQYYSLLQKLFISYIFKNLELFIEQIYKNQSLGEYVVNNLVNSIPKSTGNLNETNSNELNMLVQNINDQMILLKNINHYGVNLTSALSSNFEDLKSNGIKIFKAMDPSIQQSVVSNLNFLVNSLSESNQGNMTNQSNGFLSSPDILNKNSLNQNNDVHINNNLNNPGNNSSYDAVLSNLNSLINNISNNNNNLNNLNSNLFSGGMNHISQFNTMSKGISGNNTNNNMNSSTGLNGINQVSNLMNQTMNNISSIINNTNKPVNKFPHQIPSNFNMTSQVLSELLSQSNSSSQGSQSLNILNAFANLNKNLINSNPNMTGGNSLNTNTNQNYHPLSSLLSSQVGNSLLMNMMGMNQLNQISQMNQINHMQIPQVNQGNQMNSMSQIGKSLLEKMSNLYPTSQSDVNQNQQDLSRMKTVNNLPITENPNFNNEKQMNEEENDIEIENVDVKSQSQE